MWILNDAKNCCSQSAFLALDNQGFARVELERSESSVRIETCLSGAGLGTGAAAC